MIMNKKGDLSINIIIVAAIALIILVIISVLVFNTGGSISEGTSCEGIGGTCATACSEIGGGTFVRHPTASCVDEATVCCIPL